MGSYNEVTNYKPHSFNNTTLLIDKEHKAVGVEMVEVELTEDEVTVQTSADGHAIFVETPGTSGIIRFQCLEASATNEYMWDLLETRATFSISMLDKEAPTLDVSSPKCRIGKRPVIRRLREHDVVEWVCVCTYIKCRGGSYRLDAA